MNFTPSPPHNKPVNVSIPASMTNDVRLGKIYIHINKRLKLFPSLLSPHSVFSSERGTVDPSRSELSLVSEECHQPHQIPGGGHKPWDMPKTSHD